MIDLISVALASGDAPVNETQGLLLSIVPYILILFVFYLIFIKPSIKKEKEHKEQIDNIKVNTKVITKGGVIGTVFKKKDKNNTIIVKIADDVNIEVEKYSLNIYQDDNDKNNESKQKEKDDSKKQTSNKIDESTKE